ncbi:FabD/lysophospholipase-like protein [Clavulina sp. PMI_390]|nr:FabD/lysophospholipase-like protein [Clavulina sp. PMI_390]
MHRSQARLLVAMERLYCCDIGSRRSSRIVCVAFSAEIQALDAQNYSFGLANESLLAFRATVNDLLLELYGAEGSLFHKITSTPPDPTVNPECSWDAEVRLGEELCLSERAFLTMRRRHMRLALAKLFDVPVEAIDERDIPTLAIAASGGGLRAMCNTAGTLTMLKDAGILDCVTYIAGISGSTWSMGALYSGVAGLVNGVPSPLLTQKHLQTRITVPYVDSSALDLLTKPPTNSYLLTGLIRKATIPLTNISITDIYGTLISSRILVPDNVTPSSLDPRFLSLHAFRQHVDNGALPMPIFTAVSRHLPENLSKEESAIKKEQTTLISARRSERLNQRKDIIEDEARWLWFEFTPYETGCDELGAWIPSWALGRRFQAGKSIDRAPEVSFSILSGIFASAFCASLQHYFNEARPLLRQLPIGLYDWLARIIEENEAEIDAMHAVVPNALPNYVKGLDGELRAGSPPQITEPDNLGFMPLFRRNVDCVIALDASADGHDLWFTRAEEFALRRGLSTWPKGARWPVTIDEEGNVTEQGDVPSGTSPSDTANRKLAQAQEGQLAGQQKKQQDTDERSIPSSSESSASRSNESPSDAKAKAESPSSQEMAASVSASPTSSAHLWIGSSGDGKPLQSSRASELTEEKLAAHDGIGIIYFPLFSNRAVPGFDPLSISTWRFELQEGESTKLFDTAKANTGDGEEMVIKVLKAMWLRKKRAREEKERSSS